jgi:uncharacterized membrane protein
MQQIGLTARDFLLTGLLSILVGMGILNLRGVKNMGKSPATSCAARPAAYFSGGNGAVH